MPNTLEENVNKVKAAKTAIANAITAKGGTVNSSDGLEDFSVDISTIPTGGHKVLITTNKAGAVVTLSKTGKTYTAVASSNSVATFEGVESGTYTVIATFEGDSSTPTTIIIDNHTAIARFPTQWDNFRDLVRAGTAPTQYPVGTLLYDDWGNSSSTAYRIVSYDQYFDSDLTAQGYDHSVTLLEEYLDETIAFNTVEAFLYLTQDLPAGTYYFIYPSSSICRFTTTKLVPSGGQLCLKRNTNSSSVQGYASPFATSYLFEVATSEASSGTFLGTMQTNATTNVTYGVLNAYNRATSGSNNYYESAIRQLINATTKTGWWTPQTIFDRPVNNYSSGKIYRLNSDFVYVLASPDITSIANTVYEIDALDGTTFTLGTTYAIKDKLFLPAPMELNFSDTDTSVGSIMSYYSGAVDSQRIKYKKSSTSTAGSYYLRTPYTTNAAYARISNKKGSLSSNLVYDIMAGNAVTACVIQ